MSRLANNGIADGFAGTRSAASISAATGRRRNRGGFSLLELLVVVFILLTITAISLPLVVPAMSGRQVREGARMLNTFINAARNRAIETGRSSGVWIERLPGLREAAANIYYAEIPPVYSGDYLDSQAELFIVNGVPTSSSGTMSGSIFTAPKADASCKDYWNIVVPRSRTTFNTDTWASPDPLDQQVVREGDLIQFEGSDIRVPLKVVKMSIAGATSASSNNLWWYIYRGRNCAYNTGPDGPYTNERDLNGAWSIRWFERNININTGLRITTTVPFNYNLPGLKYKIYRQPIKLQAGSIKLPDGVVIDLGFSSITNGNNSDSGMPFHARCDTTSSATMNNAWWGPPVYPQDETPVILVFSPGGHIERVFFRMTEGNSGTAATNRQWLWGGMEPFGQIHFLIGKTEKVLPDEYYLKSQDATTNYEKQKKKNWLDTENFWVNVNPQTGFVSTSVVNGWGSVGTATNITQALIGEAQFDPANNETGAANPARVYQTRLKARYARVVGGN